VSPTNLPATIIVVVVGTWRMTSVHASNLYGRSRSRKHVQESSISSSTVIGWGKTAYVPYMEIVLRQGSTAGGNYMLETEPSQNKRCIAPHIHDSIVLCKQ